MRDSGAFKPLYLFPILFVAIAYERGWMPSVIETIKVPAWILVVIALFFFVYFFRKSQGYKYVKPTASYVSPGVIRVRGSAHELQRNFNKITSTATWNHIDFNEWTVEMPNCNWQDTEQIVDIINEETR